MTTPNEEPALSPEDEALAAQFAEQLESVQGIGISQDEDEQLWLAMGEMAVPITAEQAAEFTSEVYKTALAKIKAQRPPTQPAPRVHAKVTAFVATTMVAGVGAVVIAVVYNLVRNLIR